MAKEETKDFNAMLHRDTDMPKIQIITDPAVIQKYGGDFTDPITAGIFVSMAAWASHQRQENKTPYWRTLKAGGELNANYPGGLEEQRKRLEAEGHTVLAKGRTHLRYFVKDYENALWDLDA